MEGAGASDTITRRRDLVCWRYLEAYVKVRGLRRLVLQAYLPIVLGFDSYLLHLYSSTAFRGHSFLALLVSHLQHAIGG